jgi:hypothetical protein
MRLLWLVASMVLAPLLASGSTLLSRSGKPRVVIVPQPDAIPAELHAVGELRHHLNLVTGGAFTVHTKSSDVPRSSILVGPGPLSSKYFPEFDLAKFGPEVFVIRSRGNRLLLAGGRPRGTLYAVNRFLQEQCGVRWWTPWATNLPRQATLRVPDLHVRGAPAFEYRAPFWYCGFDPLWKVRNGVNSEWNNIPAEWGGCVKYKGHAHTFYPLVPPEKHFDRHPEWYSLIKGKRTHDHSQLCLANQELRDFVVARVKQWLRDSPDAAIISVTQNDWHGACECPDCQAIDAAEGSPAGSLLTFVNYVAERIEPEFPHVAVDTFAYQYTRKPPKTIKPRPNVIVRLCSIECNFREPLDHPSNAAFLADLKGWAAICQRLYIWDYTTDFRNYVNPHPNWFVLGPNLRLFQTNHVRGVFEQGAYQGFGGELAELRAWVLAQLLWNPQQDDRALIREFLEGYYGPAAAPIGRYLELMQRESKDYYLACFLRPNAPHLKFKPLTEAEALWSEAERLVAGDPELLARVRLGHLPVRHAFLARWDSLRRECQDQGAIWPLAESRPTVLDQFREICAGVPVRPWTRVNPLNEGGLKAADFK